MYNVHGYIHTIHNAHTTLGALFPWLRMGGCPHIYTYIYVPTQWRGGPGRIRSLRDDDDDGDRR